MKMRQFLTCFLTCTVPAAVVLAAPRDLMIRTLDTTHQVVELHNFGATDIDLSGYRFCSHDDNQTFQYSAPGGLNGVTIEAGTSLFVHFLNDAPAGPDHIDIAGRGFFAAPLDNGPYGLQLYFPPVLFGDGNTMADHVQWNVNGVDDITADERSDEAQMGGLWVNQSEWVATTATTQIIRLDPGAESTVLHGAADYGAFDGPAPRDLMLRSLDTAGQVVELHNFSTVDADLSGYRFCSHDDNQNFQYSSPGGLNGLVVEAGTSLFVHYLNDAPADPDHIDIAGRGFFAIPLDNGPYGLQIYFPPVLFGDGNTIADHVQWSVNGADDLVADERSDEAQSGGVWADQSEWVSTSAGTETITLVDGAEFRVLHDAADYVAAGGVTAGGRIRPTDPLLLERSGGGLRLSWGASCQAGDDDYGVYEGTIGVPDVYDSLACSTGGATTFDVPAPAAGSVFYLVVPNDGTDEGSYGLKGDGSPRPQAAAACSTQSVNACP